MSGYFRRFWEDGRLRAWLLSYTGAPFFAAMSAQRMVCLVSYFLILSLKNVDMRTGRRPLACHLCTECSRSHQVVLS